MNTGNMRLFSLLAKRNHYRSSWFSQHQHDMQHVRWERPYQPKSK